MLLHWLFYKNNRYFPPKNVNVKTLKYITYQLWIYLRMYSSKQKPAFASEVIIMQTAIVTTMYNVLALMLLFHRLSHAYFIRNLCNKINTWFSVFECFPPKEVEVCIIIIFVILQWKTYMFLSVLYSNTYLEYSLKMFFLIMCFRSLEHGLRPSPLIKVGGNEKEQSLEHFGCVIKQFKKRQCTKISSLTYNSSEVSVTFRL